MSVNFAFAVGLYMTRLAGYYLSFHVHDKKIFIIFVKLATTKINDNGLCQKLIQDFREHNP